MNHQHELRERFPGAAGGFAVREQRGQGYLAALGQRGGRATRDRHGPAYMAELARRGATERWRRHREQPRTQTTTFSDGEVLAERLVPWWPHQPGRRRRKRPVIVRIWASEPADE
jgi:hypothetical protein